MEHEQLEAKEVVPSIEEKLETARRALEGEEHARKRLADEEKAKKRSQLEALNKRLADLEKQKETLELAWVDLDEKRRVARQKLEPILAKEKETEELEAKSELTESKTISPPEKQKIEAERWVTQTKRHGLEQEKWVIQEELWKLEQKIEETTKQYRALLSEEDKTRTELADLSGE